MVIPPQEAGKTEFSLPAIDVSALVDPLALCNAPQILNSKNAYWQYRLLGTSNNRLCCDHDKAGTGQDMSLNRCLQDATIFFEVIF
jgi:hypothetical protein